MPIAVDPLSLVFIACFLFGLLFLVATTLMGSLGHGTHAAHSVHGGTHVGHVGAGHNTQMVHAQHFVAKGSLAKTTQGMSPYLHTPILHPSPCLR